ncbi:MAG: hypothetical protein PHP10_06375 [Candidatus Omnitrophica bacterium]|nr:hypothetical protein [Candidatus Omnitrophota bacterium]
MKVYLKAVIMFAVAALVTGSIGELVYAGVDQECSCCDNKCQDAKNCHDDTKACLCGYQAPLQVYLLKNETLPNLEFCGLFTHRPRSANVYLITEDIFHPPKLIS